MSGLGEPRDRDPAPDRPPAEAADEAARADAPEAADEAARVDAPGVRQDPPGGPFVVDEEGAVVDTGSPQDYGPPNDEVKRVER